MNKYHDPIIEERIKQWKNGTRNETDDLLDVMISLKDDNKNSLLTHQEIKALILVITFKIVFDLFISFPIIITYKTFFC